MKLSKDKNIVINPNLYKQLNNHLVKFPQKKNHLVKSFFLERI